MKVVLDTNVLLSAFGSHGLCEAVFETCLARHELVLSEHILDEVRRNLVAKFKTTPGHPAEIVAFLREQATLVAPERTPASACRDRTDLAVLGTAKAAATDCLVTGDKELLALGRFGVTEILSPRAFHDRLR
ncbi:MAG: putative toxin-antitoxin system toxin component, PIN family [Phycisphaerae bacterium]|nr:putative toxin-antitoxin system toxin component, PIN family [Phycisphaerae bacterium]